LLRGSSFRYFVLFLRIHAHPAAAPIARILRDAGPVLLIGPLERSEEGGRGVRAAKKSGERESEEDVDKAAGNPEKVDEEKPAA